MKKSLIACALLILLSSCGSNEITSFTSNTSESITESISELISQSVEESDNIDKDSINNSVDETTGGISINDSMPSDNVSWGDIQWGE